MAANETQFQNEMVDATRKAGGVCWKMKSLSKNGIPDLHVILPRVTGWIECKFWDAFKVKGKVKPRGEEGPMKSSMSWVLRTTPLQRQRIKELHSGSSVAGWAVCVKVDHNLWNLYVGIHEDKKFIHEDFFCQRKSGSDWPVEDIVRHIQLKQQMVQWQD